MGVCLSFWRLWRKEAVHGRQVGRRLVSVEEEEHQWRRLRQMWGAVVRMENRWWSFIADSAVAYGGYGYG